MIQKVESKVDTLLIENFKKYKREKLLREAKVYQTRKRLRKIYCHTIYLVGAFLFFGMILSGVFILVVGASKEVRVKITNLEK